MKKSILRQACENSYGYFEATPGSDLARNLSNASESTIKRYIAKGWLKKVGSGLVLTREGHAVA